MKVWSLAESRPAISQIIINELESAPIRGRGGRRAKYPWKQLAVNASFFVQVIGFANMEKLWNSLTSCRANAQRKTGFKFEMRRVSSGIRVWRVK